ncbi:MAG TPA: isoprenylcysteine carboxylmethyltransferase family protein [Terracidiphilus sp.]|nr:isoprenylcysteine carboxylmethyltransferase family protein [Terracidiphilus sp.]
MRMGKTNSVDRESRALPLIGTAIFLFVVPGAVAGYIPWFIGKGRVHAPFFGFITIRVVGGVLMAAGIVILLEAFLRFALEGLGTPAPILPPKRLVVTGSYRYVRNPMYVAVVSLILGQGLIFGDVRVIVYGLCAWLITHLFVLFYEEPTLRRSFPADYADFSTHVPRWIPRLTPWHEGS